MVQKAEPKFVAVLRQESHRWGCISPKVARSSRGEGRDYFLLLAHLVCAMVSLGHPSTGEESTDWRSPAESPKDAQGAC